MQKPGGDDEARATGDYTPVELGGHYCTIVGVKETQSSNGKDMIVVAFDFAQQDKQPGYFNDAFQNDSRPKGEKKWPYAGTSWIMVNDYENPNKTSRKFKTFCTCVEESNNYEIKWGGSNWEQQFKGKKIGAVYGEEENEYNGKTFMRSAFKWFCKWDAVKDARIPNPKYLSNNNTSGGAAPAADNNEWMNVPDNADEEIPF